MKEFLSKGVTWLLLFFSKDKNKIIRYVFPGLFLLTVSEFFSSQYI